MKYVNKQNGFVIETNCIVSGENWERVQNKVQEKEEVKVETKKKSKK